jgi:S1-C subfamily serine protease
MPLAETYERVRPACVAIALVEEEGNEVRFLTFGSGACVDRTGIVVTAKHVVEGYYQQVAGVELVPGEIPGPRFQVVFGRTGAERHEILHASVNGVLCDAERDIALLRIPPLPRGWPSIELPGPGSRIREGQPIATAGFPLRSWSYQNMLPHLFSGVVSQVHISFQDGKARLDQLDVDVCIHPGHSGGPVFDAETGELLGIVSSQRLRDLDVVELLKVQASGESDDPLGTAHVWTNITQCVPSTTIRGGVAVLKESGEQAVQPDNAPR